MSLAPSCRPLPPLSVAAEATQMFSLQIGSWRMGLGWRTRPSFASHLQNNIQVRMWVVLLPALWEAVTLPHPHPPLLSWKHSNLGWIQSHPTPLEKHNVAQSHVYAPSALTGTNRNSHIRPSVYIRYAHMLYTLGLTHMHTCHMKCTRSFIPQTFPTQPVILSG